MKKTEDRNEIMKKAEHPNEILPQDVEEVTNKGVECGGPSVSNMNEAADNPSEKLSDMHTSDEDRDNEPKAISVKVKNALVGAKDRVLGAFDSKSKEGGRKSWGQWALDGVRYAKDKVGGGSSVSEDEKGFAGKVQDHVTEGVGTLVRSFRTGMPIGETEVLAENEPPDNITDDIKRGASGICSAVSGKATGMARGLKKALTFDIGSGSDNSKETEEEHRNSSSQQEKSVQAKSNA